MDNASRQRPPFSMLGSSLLVWLPQCGAALLPPGRSNGQNIPESISDTVLWSDEASPSLNIEEGPSARVTLAVGTGRPFRNIMTGDGPRFSDHVVFRVLASRSGRYEKASCPQRFGQQRLGEFLGPPGGPSSKRAGFSRDMAGKAASGPAERAKGAQKLPEAP